MFYTHVRMRLCQPIESSTKWLITFRRDFKLIFSYKMCFIFIKIAQKIVATGPVKICQYQFR